MKPKNNRIYCHACGRAKMLFETEAKADNFIKFNTEDFMKERRHAPVRSYYCAICQGWHVTSHELDDYSEVFDRKDQELLEQVDKLNAKIPVTYQSLTLQEKQEIERETKEKEREEWLNTPEGIRAIAIQKHVSQYASRIPLAFGMGYVDEIENLLSDYEAILYQDYSELGSPFASLDFSKIKEKLRKYKDWYQVMKTIFAAPEEERDQLLEPYRGEALYKTLKMAVDNQSTKAEVEALLDTLQTRLESDEELTDEVELVEQCESIFRKIRGAGRKEFIKPLSARLTPMKAQIYKQAHKNLHKSLPEYSPMSEEEYKQAIIALISDCERARQALKQQDYAGCEDILDIATMAYEKLPKKNKDTQVIKKVIGKLNIALEILRD